MQKESQSDDQDDASEQSKLLALTSEVVAAYAGNNSVSTADLPDLISNVHAKLSALAGASKEPAVAQKPAVPIKRSVKKEAITCLECGKAQTMLKRHLGSAHDMTPDEYREKWQLPYSYPMVAPDYAEKRRALAKQIGLGRKPTKSPAPKRKASRKKTA